MPTLFIKQYREAGFRIDDLETTVKGLTKVSGSSTSAIMKLGSTERYEITGTGLKFDRDGDLISGTITKMVVKLTIAGKLTKALEFSGANVSVSKLLSDDSYRPFKGWTLDYNAEDFYSIDKNGVDFTGSTSNDIINGSKYSDVLRGGNGSDKIYGGSGNDVIFAGSGTNQLYGESGDDALISGQYGDHLNGGSGSDWVSYEFATSGLTANLTKSSANTGWAKGDTYSSIENVIGSKFSDVITGNTKDNVLYGWDGNDTLSGGDGDDILIGGAGADKLVGGSGSDTAAYSHKSSFFKIEAAKAVVVDMQQMSRNTGDAKGDTYSSIENVTGTNLSDVISGNNSANVLTGLSGDDRLEGRGGNDRLFGGAGADRLYGGSGADTFIYKSVSDSTPGRPDTVFDFSRSQGDKIDLSAIDANTKVSGNQAFSFIGTESFHKKAGELRISKQASDTYVHLDVNGDGKADATIHFDDAISFSKSDFIL